MTDLETAAENVVNENGFGRYIAGIRETSEGRIRIVPKKKYKVLEAHEIRAISADGLKDAMNGEIASGAFFKLDMKTLPKLVAEGLREDPGIAGKIPEDMLEPALGILGECLRGILYDEEGGYMERAAEAMIRKSLSFERWNGDRMVMRLYGMLLSVPASGSGISILNEGTEAEKMRTCAAEGDAFERGFEKIRMACPDASVRIRWDGGGRISGFMINAGRIYEEKLSGRTFSEAFVPAADELADDAERDAEMEERRAAEEDEAEEGAILSDASNSKAYGNILCTEILTSMLRVGGECDLRVISNAVIERHPFLSESEICGMMGELSGEGVIYLAEGRCGIRSESEAECYADPYALHWRREEGCADFSDADWEVFLENENQGDLTDADWSEAVKMLDRPLLLDECMDAAAAFFSGAPDSVRRYAELIAEASDGPEGGPLRELVERINCEK